ncbi:AAA family ATPase [Bizionia myxarmorum]|uniref:AAA family ATPase n=1 Tax=Bizionia myxarmorum TaxID=291186 RepID=A0A5D0RC58_9FLAO|nr:ATP-binding protein [Bizionia myxarmorum]TYB79260.1 AAA family ATPase [Bizionia myxarmorum]
MAYQNSTIKSKNNPLTLDELHLNNEVRDKIDQLLEEFTYIDALNKLHIPVDNKILLHGHTGCGKTATAHAIGLALNKNVITIDLSGFISSRLGETGKNLAELFKRASTENAILFIDEFDFIGKLRDYDIKDSGEMKRLVNSLIQQVDYLADNSLLICATNHIDIIDTAILRRFQIKLNYELPSKDNLDRYYNRLLSSFPETITNINRTYGISYAEAKDLTYQQIKAHAIQLEKNKKHLIFMYAGFLINNLENQFSSEIGQERKDSISGYQLQNLNSTEALTHDKGENMIPQIAMKSKVENDLIDGFVFEITGEELLKIDKNMLSHYKRVQETTNLGTAVWVYVSRNIL